jgi:hypothetical protein
MSSVKIIKKTSYSDGRRNHKGFQHNARLLGHEPPYSNDVKQEVTDYINRSNNTEAQTSFTNDYMNKVYQRAVQLGADPNGLGDVSNYDVASFTPAPEDVRFSQSDSGKRLNEFLSQLMTAYANDVDYDYSTGVTNPNERLLDNIITPLLDNVNNNGMWNVQGLANTFKGITIGTEDFPINAYNQAKNINNKATQTYTSNARGEEMLGYIRSLVNRQTANYSTSSYTSLRDMQLSLQRDIVSMRKLIRQKQEAINDEVRARKWLPTQDDPDEPLPLKDPNVQKWIKTKRKITRITNQLSKKRTQFYSNTGFFPDKDSGWLRGLDTQETYTVLNTNFF